MTISDDREVIEAQLGRGMRADSSVVSRCHLNLPVVVQVPPILDDGTPFPTLFWLTCPLAVTRIGRLEGAGGVKRMEQKTQTDPVFAERLDRAHQAYEAKRDAILDEDIEPRPSGGVGGARAGVKCLHAHFAHTTAGGDNPVGELVDGWISPLDCGQPCVVGGERNPKWVSLP